MESEPFVIFGAAILTVITGSAAAVGWLIERSVTTDILVLMGVATVGPVAMGIRAAVGVISN